MANLSFKRGELLFYPVDYLTIRKAKIVVILVAFFRKKSSVLENSNSIVNTLFTIRQVFFKLTASQHLSIPSVVNRWLSWFRFHPGEHCHVTLREGHAGCSRLEQHMDRASALVVPGMDRWM